MRSLSLVAATALATALAAACSSDPADGLTTGSRAPGSGEYADDPQAGGGAGGGGAGGSATDPSTPPPGVESNEAKAFYLQKIHTPLASACASCHATGTEGAPVFMDNDSSKTYAMLEARGYIVPSSMLVRKGAHKGPALAADLASLIAEWVTLEGKVRGGKAPVNLFAKLGGCVDAAKFDAINLDDLRTIKRDGENANNCTGCNQARCTTCHKEGEAGFHASFGGLGTDTVDALKQNARSPEGVYLITKYIATNGTTLIPSTALKDKATATKTDVNYGHPLYEVGGNVDAALQAFAQDIITKYNAKQCGQ